MTGLFLATLSLLILIGCQSTGPPTATIEPTLTPDFVGQPLKGSRPAIYRLMAEGHLRHLDDWATYLALGYQPDELITLTDDQLNRYPLGPPLTRWVTGPNKPYIYTLQAGQRYRLPDKETLLAQGGSLLEVSLLPTDLLTQFPLADEPLPAQSRSVDDQNHPQVTAAQWANGYLWVANETGLLTQWDIQNGTYQTHYLPNEPTIRALATDGSTLYAGTEIGELWQVSPNGQVEPLMINQIGWLAALALDDQQRLWYADVSHFDWANRGYQLGRGIGHYPAEAAPRLTTDRPPARDPLRQVTQLRFDAPRQRLWVGTRFAGVWFYDLEKSTWQHFDSFNSPLADNRINDVALSADGSLWVATPAGLSLYVPSDGGLYNEGQWENFPFAEGISENGALSIAIASEGTIWVGGDGYLAWRHPGETWQVYTGLVQSLLADQFRVVLDGQQRPWFLGRYRKIHFDGQRWWAYGVDVRQVAEFTLSQPSPTSEALPTEFPSPLETYTAWLQTWPRPVADNGRCLHFVQTHWLAEIEAQQQINRLKRLGVRWTLVNYANHYQLQRLAPLFAEASIMVVWRPFVRPYEQYEWWAEDVQFLLSRGQPPYMQLYNEPSLAQEWPADQPIDRAMFEENLLSAIQTVYDAGGYVGLQFIEPSWLEATLQQLQTAELTHIYDRLFFIPHPYGLNHPPAYDDDINSVLGFREFAAIFEAEIGFVPPMIAGEGGWRPGEAQDDRYPPVSEADHRDYHVAVFDWFRTGRLSNGEPLPDYLFAFCPWLIADPHDPAAWFDSSAGDRRLTIEAVEAMPHFERTFSWDD